MINSYPAIVIGGPPHSGKSVLTYNLSQALRVQAVEHFVVRACPDSEGDYSEESSSELIRKIRQKGRFNTAFVENICQALGKRHYPLMVDVGGKPTEEQEVIFGECTHAIIISSDPGATLEWRRRVERHGLTLLADLISTLDEPDELFSETPVLRGRVSGLGRGQKVDGVVFDKLVEKVSAFFAEYSADIRLRYMSASPSTPLDLARLATTLNVEIDQDGRTRWLPSDLQRVIDYLPANEPLSVYGRGPAWLYAAIANHVYPAALHQFDPCLGWVTPLLPVQAAPLTASESPPAKLMWTLDEQVGFSRLELTIESGDGYLDYEDELQVEPTFPQFENGLIISGALPHWLVTGLVNLFDSAPLIAAFYPQVNGAVVVKSSLAEWPIGSIIW